ncbi:MAG: hypothetical protein E4H36_10915 [Spirochaetales bacterium]|nr:MAG: hypothetical protein E4H36_10915 [Spirochaetales bacterium]
MLEIRQKWLIRNSITAAVLALLWNTILLRPMRVLIVFLHEAFHAAAALVTGGGVRMIEILSHESGVARLYGGWPVLVYSAGYLGTALTGSLLLGAYPWFPLKRFIYLGLGVFLLSNTLIFVRNPFGWAYGLVSGLFFAVMFFREFSFSPYLADLVGLLCIMDVIYSMIGFILFPGKNDAGILHEASGISYGAVLAVWIAMSFAVIVGAFFFAWLAMEPGRLKEKLEWRDFRIMTKKRIASVTAAEKRQADEDRRRSRRTLLSYLTVFGSIIILILWASRFVLFQPWTAREWTSAAAVGDRIYIIGGRDREGQVFGEIYRADPGKRRLKKTARLPSPRFGAGVAALGNKIFIVGGFDGRTYFDDILVFDTGTGKVERLGSLPTVRCFGSLAASDSMLYYAGGWDGEKQTAEILALNPADGESSILARLPTAREHLSSVYFRDKLYFFGGIDAEGRYLSEILSFDPSGREVMYEGELPYPLARSMAAVLDGSIILAGGWEGRKLPEVLTLELSDPAFSVDELMQLPQGVSDSPVVPLMGRLYIIGGSHERFNRQIRMWEIDPQTKTLSSIKFRNFLFW